MVSFSAGGSTLMAWKRRSSDRSFSMYFRVLGRRRGADAPDLAPRERRLEDVGGIERPFGRPGAHQRVQLVDEHDDVGALGQFLHDGLEALLELPAVLRARDDERDVEREDPLVGQEVRHVPEADLLGEALHDGGLAHPGFADEHRVVLGAAAQHLLHALELVVTSDQRVERVLHRRFGEVAAELGQQRRLLPAREGRLLVQELDDVFAHGVEPHPLLHEDGGRHRALLAQDPQQEVFGADVVVEQPIRLFGGRLQHPARLDAERNLDGGRDLVAEDGPSLDLLADALQ